MVHERTCMIYRAINGPAIECEHGYDFCPECDKCTCGVEKHATIADHDRLQNIQTSPDQLPEHL